MGAATLKALRASRADDERPSNVFRGRIVEAPEVVLEVLGRDLP